VTEVTESSSGDSFLTAIESVSNQAEGIARHKGKVVFVPYTLPGERVRVRVTETHRDYDRAEVVRVTKRSDHRVEAPCPYFGTCGGCQLQHAAYEQAVEFKGRAFLETLQRIGKIQVTLPPLVPSPPYGYRNRSRFFATGSADLPFGLKRAGSPEDVLPVARCLLVSPRIEYAFEETARCVGTEMSRGTRLPFTAATFQEMGTGLSVTVEGVPQDREYTENWSEVLGEVTEIRAAHLARLRSRHRVSYETLFGDREWIHQLGHFDIPAAPGTFHQVNDAVGEKLYDTVLGWIGKQWDTAVEVYCGTGTLAAQFSRRFRSVLAADENHRAVELAKRAYSRPSQSQLRFYEMPGEKFLFHKDVASNPVDLLVLDPPRAGCSPRVMQGIAARRPRRVVLVSCHAAAFARDLGKLVSSGYEIRDLRALDMFPQTYHLEAAAVLGRVS